VTRSNLSGLAKLVTAVAFVVSAASGLAGGQPGPSTTPSKTSSTAHLCAANEQTFFACVTSRRRFISVCGASPNNIQYRFGSSTTKVDLTFPKNIADGAKQFAYAHYSRYQVERTEISFKNQGTRYSVFDYTESGKRSAGVNIETPDGKESSLRCLKSTRSNLVALEKSVPCDSESALNQGICPAR
jgi:hypothetical protein